MRPMHIYGLTETYGPMTTSGGHPEWEELDMDERARLMARQGQGYTTADLVRVVDENMNDVERDGETMGEIVMHGNMVAKGYFENEEATEEAFDVLKKGQEATEDEIIDFCKERIARFKAPAAVEFTELPKTSTGKVQKFVLREKEWADREKQVN